MSIFDKLLKKGLFKSNPPSFLKNNVHYMTIMGSHAYGVADTSDPKKKSDFDVYGMCIPEKHMIFPHLAGEIRGFGRQKKRFEQWQEHHVLDLSSNTEYDFTIYNIVKYFQLCMDNNPNMIDSLFTPQNCVLLCTSVGNHLRDNRKLFLHKGAWHKFKGYAFSQAQKMRTKHESAKKLFHYESKYDFDPDWLKKINQCTLDMLIQVAKEASLYEIDYIETLIDFRKNETKRTRSVREYGYDLKFGYHIVRLLGEVEQILIEGDLDLQRKDRREMMKSVRRGEWSLERLMSWFADKEKALERTYEESKLQYSPDEDKIKSILIECLEMHYGSLDNALKVDVSVEAVLRELEAITDKYRRKTSHLTRCKIDTYTDDGSD